MEINNIVEVTKDLLIMLNPLEREIHIPCGTLGIIESLGGNISVVKFNAYGSHFVEIDYLKVIDKPVSIVSNQDYEKVMQSIFQSNAFELMIKHNIVIQRGSTVIRAEVNTEEICWNYRTPIKEGGFDDVADTIRIINDAVKLIGDCDE